MTGVRYKKPMLSAKAILAYAKPVGEDIYSFNLNKAETAERTEEARRFLCAWCSLPYETVSNKALAFHASFPELHSEYPNIVDENGAGWYWRRSLKWAVCLR